MAGFYADRVCETSSSTGTGSFDMLGAIPGYQRFSAAFGGTGVTCYYLIEEVDTDGVPTGPWEAGIGIYGPGAVSNRLGRTQALAGSSGTSLVTFSSGRSRVHLIYPAQAASFAGAQVKCGSDLTTQNFTTATAIPWNQDQYQTDVNNSFHDTVTNNTRLIIPTVFGDSTVRLSGQISLSLETASDLVTLTIRQGGTTTKAKSQAIISGTAGCFQIKTPVLSNVAVNAYFELLVQTSTDVSVTLVAADSWFEMEVLQ